MNSPKDPITTTVAHTVAETSPIEPDHRINATFAKITDIGRPIAPKEMGLGFPAASASNAMIEDTLRENARIPEGNTPNRTRNHPNLAIDRDQEMNLDITKRKTKAKSTFLIFFF